MLRQCSVTPLFNQMRMLLSYLRHPLKGTAAIHNSCSGADLHSVSQQPCKGAYSFKTCSIDAIHVQRRSAPLRGFWDLE